MAPQVVIDSNIWVGGCTPDGSFPDFELDRLTLESVLSSYRAAFTKATLLELIYQLTKVPRILRNTQPRGTLVAEMANGLLETERFFEVVERIETITEDPTDNRFLEAAIASNALFILSNDKHLRRLGSFRKIPILNSREFLASSFHTSPDT